MTNAIDALQLLTTALTEHDAAYPNGDWKSANDRIVKARVIANDVISRAGKWPERFGLNFIGNDQAVSLLQEIIAVEKEKEVDKREALKKLDDL